jgi:hypothetical protein
MWIDILKEGMIYATAYLVVIFGGRITVSKILAYFSHSDNTTGLKGAGTTIGILERILTLTFVFLNQYAAIALVITAKSIARFEELKKRKFSEYYLIGTLSSILFAIIVGIISKWIMKVII